MATVPRNRRRQVLALIGPSKSTFARLSAPCRFRRFSVRGRGWIGGADGLNRSHHLDRAESRVVISPRKPTTAGAKPKMAWSAADLRSRASATPRALPHLQGG